MRVFVSAAALLAAAGLWAPPAQADSLETIAYEGFDYPAGDSGSGLTNLNGGSGWEDAWAFPYTPALNTFQPLQFDAADNLTYPNQTSVGGGASWFQKFTADPNGSGRLLPMLDSGVVYFQFLSDIDNTSRGGGTPNIRLSTYDTATQTRVATGGIGNNDGRSNMALLNASLQEVSGGVSSVNMNGSAAPNGANLTIVRFNYDAQETDMWVNPDMSSFDYLDPPTATVSVTSYAPAFNRIDIYFANNGIIDEIKVMRVLSAEEAAARANPERETLALQSVEGVSCTGSAMAGTRGTWINLPGSDQCTVSSQPSEPDARVLGWATTSTFPVEIAQRQVDNGWGAYELFDVDGRLAAVFIPAGGATFLSNSTNLYPIIG